MSSLKLTLNKRDLLFDDIILGKFERKTIFEQSTLAFCRLWLNGQTTFNLKTSGSTGNPKTIEVSREQMLLSARQTINIFNLKPADTVLVCLNTAYIAGIMMLVRAFESGAKIIAVEPSGNPLIDISGQLDFMAIVPLQLQQILDDPISKSKLENCRATIVGGTSVSFELATNLSATSAAVYATFGMTETLTHFALRELNPVRQEFYTVLDDVKISKDKRGCLTVISPVTGQEKLVTNDMVEIISDKEFKWIGRIDNIINSGGIKLQIEEIELGIEKAFLEIEVSNRFFIGGKPDPVLGERVILVVENAGPLPQLMQINWAAYLGQYQRPKEIFYKAQFAETPTGKIDRKQSI